MSTMRAEHIAKRAHEIANLAGIIVAAHIGENGLPVTQQWFSGEEGPPGFSVCRSDAADDLVARAVEIAMKIDLEASERVTDDEGGA